MAVVNGLSARDQAVAVNEVLTEVLDKLRELQIAEQV